MVFPPCCQEFLAYPRLPSGGYETLFFLISSFYLIPLKKSMDSRKSNLDKITPLYYS
ncbi:hypothetical protein HMPREF1548_06711 [Clostridium sp. KLE 1755]|nr:hypothetical protein HMPREF1548_06711 [Clostridium sp. KLE 1755]